MENLSEFEKEFCFEPSDFVGENVKPSAILQQFQDVAVKHATLLGCGFDEMIKKDLIWVLMRTKYQMQSHPRPNQMLKIKTYPSGKNMLEFDRDFLILDMDGNVILKGTSKWCFINFKTRRIAKMDLIGDISLPDSKPLFEGRFLKNELFEPEYLADATYKILPEHIDGNNHTNNTVYAKMIEPFCLNNKNLKFFQINFLEESHLGDLLDIYAKNIDGGMEFLGKFREGKPSFFVKVKFE